MSTPRPVASRIVFWVQSCGLFFILAAMLLAWSAAAVHFAGKMFSNPAAPAILLGALGYLALAGIGLAGLRRVWTHFGPGPFLLTVLGLSLLIQIGVICASNPEWNWTGDAAIFKQYLERLTTDGYSQATLGDLSQYYDYRIWTRRALPFYYALHAWGGDEFARAVQLFQALLLTLALALTHRTARLLFGRQTAFWATSLQLLMPFRWFSCLDLNHHLLGGFYFLAGLWLLAEWLKQTRSLVQTAGLALGAAVLMPLMRMEGGIDLVFAGAVLLVLVLAWAAGRCSARQTIFSAIVLGAVPLLASWLFVSPVARRIGQADLHHHESGAIAFMARGWAPETGGEYCATYELLDVLTAPADKKSVQFALLASQAVYNPRAIFWQLLPVKMAKYFLLGYASGAEEMLARNHATLAKHLAEGARTSFLLAAMPGMLWGGLLLLPLLRRPHRLAIVLPASLLCATYVLLGETSPRYSIYIQPFLFMLGALPCALGPRHRPRLLRASWRPALAAGASLALVFLATAGALRAARPWLARTAVRNLQAWQAAPGTQTLPLPATLAPFEIQLVPQADAAATDWGTLRIPAISPPPRSLAFYAIPAGAPSGSLSGTALLAETESGTQTSALPARIRLDYPPSGIGEIRFRSPAALPYPLRIGYATYEFDQTTSE